MVDLTLVLRLNIQKERLDQRNVVDLREHADNTVDIDPWCKRLQQVGHQRRLLIEVEAQRAVVDLDVAGLDNDILEGLVLPGVGCALHHSKSTVVELVVVDVQEDELWPQMSFLCCLDHLGDINSRPEETEVLHDTLGVVLGERNTERSKHTHVGLRTVSWWFSSAVNTEQIGI